MKRILLIVLLIVPAFFAKAQELTGKVIDGKTQAPLQYVNVGVMGKSIGTVTGKDGSFNLNLSDHPNDTLRLSMVGYVPLTFKIADAINMRDKNFVLQPATMQLNEVKVSNHKWKQVILGNTTRSKNTNASFNTGRPGNEIGTIIKIKKSPTYLKQFNASLSSTLMTDSVTMRLNFYTIKNGLPDQLLQNQNIFVTIKKGQDMITADLNPYNIVVDDKFFVSLEWVTESRAENIWFSASLFSGAIIARETSQGTWEKEGIVGLGFNVLAEY